MISRSKESSVHRKRERRKSSSGTLLQLFEEQLKRIHHTETQLITASSQLDRAVQSEELAEVILSNLQNAKQHLHNLDDIFSALEIPAPHDTQSETMERMVEDAHRNMLEFTFGPVRDAAIIVSLHKIMHLKMAVYASLCELAEVLGEEQTADLLDRMLEEEENQNKVLTEVAHLVHDDAVESSI